MRIATWNVNSMRARLDRVEEWLEQVEPDVCCFQETKLADDSFPTDRFEKLGYEVAHHGDGRWNGVAVASRVGITDVVRGFAERGETSEPAECRLISATCAGVRVMSVYVPNGRAVESEHFQAKLAFLHDLRRHLDATCDPRDAVVLCGDFNVAPEDIDVFDPAFFVGATHVTPEERDALAEVLGFGLTDVFRACYPEHAPIVLVVGLSRRGLSLRAWHADRSSAGDSGPGRPGDVRSSGPQRPKRQAAVRSRPRRRGRPASEAGSRFLTNVRVRNVAFQ